MNNVIYSDKVPLFLVVSGMTAVYRVARVVQTQSPIRCHSAFRTLESIAKFQSPFGLPNFDGFH
jgi:hypothetical protein